MNDKKVLSLSMKVRENLVGTFFPLLQKGFIMKTRVGCSVREFLLRQCMLEEDYIAGRVQSILLDGQPVDDIDAALVRDGSTLSLSGALPGLVGAVMRRGSPYASFRKTISHAGGEHESALSDGTIRLKLFNVVMRETGPSFLERGIIVETADLASILAAEEDDFWAGCVSIGLEGSAIAGPEVVKRLLSAQGEVNLSVSR